MGDMYKYPVFFECHNLQLENMKELKKKFLIKWLSGGAECGPLKRVNNNIYSIDFKDQSDQQNVLEKSEHVVDGLVFAVREDSVFIQNCSDPIQPTEAVYLPDHESILKRIVILGKTGYGKSSLVNTMLGETLFKTNCSSTSWTSQCQAETRSIYGRRITLIDTPGFLDTKVSEEEMKPEVVRCITECSPGPHAFLIVLKVERFTEQEEAVVSKICSYFSEEALKYAVIVFTQGDQLDEGMTIEEFVSKNQKLSELVQKCGGRCHVIDNKYWKNNEEDEYRNNRVQVEKLLHTIDKMVMENNGGCYTNEMLQVTQREIQKEVELIQQMSGHLPLEQIKTQAKAKVHSKFLVRLAGVGVGAVLGAFFGLAAAVRVVRAAVKSCRHSSVFVNEKPLEATVEAFATVVVIGCLTGLEASEGAKTVREAANKAAEEVIKRGKTILKTMPF